VPRPTGRGAKRVLVYDADRDRAALATALIVLLRAGGLPVVAATGWEDHDARFGAGPFVRGEMITSDYPSGCIQVPSSSTVSSVREGLRLSWALARLDATRTRNAASVLSTCNLDVALRASNPAARRKCVAG